MGGVSIPVDPNSQEALNASSIAFMNDTAKKALDFVQRKFIFPIFLRSHLFIRNGRSYGGGVATLLSYGEFPNDRAAIRPTSGFRGEL